MINPYYITGLDKELLAQLGKTHKTVVTLEDGVLDGGFGQKNRSLLRRNRHQGAVLRPAKRIP